MPTGSTTTHRRTEDRRARSLVEFLGVVALSVGFYWLAALLDLFERLDGWLGLHRRLQVDEGLLALPVALLLLVIYSWRRYREAQAATGVAVATEGELARANEEFRSLFDYHPHAVFSIDPERRYRRLNPAAEALSGYTEQELQSLEFPALKTEDRDRIIDAFERAMDRDPQRLEATLVRKDGQSREVDVTMVPIVVADEPVGVYVMGADVTEDKQVRRELTRALAEAKRASEAKTLLVANVSHELRTPLTSVIGAMEMLAESDLDDVQRRMAATVSRNGHVLLQLVDDLLDLTRMSAGQLTVAAVPFDLCEVLDQAVAHASAQATGKGLALSLDVDEPLPCRVIGDALRVGQVLTNLLSNAVKFTEEGEVGVGVSWQLGDQDVLETVFRVWDTGIGISPEVQERLFEPFMQADPSSTRAYGGAGLGLALSRQLVQLMGGTLSVESRNGAGSTFTVRLPLPLEKDRVGERAASASRPRWLLP